MVQSGYRADVDIAAVLSSAVCHHHLSPSAPCHSDNISASHNTHPCNKGQLEKTCAKEPLTLAQLLCSTFISAFRTGVICFGLAILALHWGSLGSRALRLFGRGVFMHYEFDVIAIAVNSWTITRPAIRRAGPFQEHTRAVPLRALASRYPARRYKRWRGKGAVSAFGNTLVYA